MVPKASTTALEEESYFCDSYILICAVLSIMPGKQVAKHFLTTGQSNYFVCVCVCNVCPQKKKKNTLGGESFVLNK